MSFTQQSKHCALHTPLVVAVSFTKEKGTWTWGDGTSSAWCNSLQEPSPSAPRRTAPSTLCPLPAACCMQALVAVPRNRCTAVLVSTCITVQLSCLGIKCVMSVWHTNEKGAETPDTQWALALMLGKAHTGCYHYVSSEISVCITAATTLTHNALLYLSTLNSCSSVSVPQCHADIEKSMEQWQLLRWAALSPVLIFPLPDHAPALGSLLPLFFSELFRKHRTQIQHLSVSCVKLQKILVESFR